MKRLNRNSFFGAGATRIALCVTIPTLMATSIWAQADTESATSTEKMYKFETIIYPGDVFTQLLGINKNDVIAGYHGSGLPGHPNKGFKLTLPNSYRNENFPFSTQTQVIGINDYLDSDGFYIDQKGVTHGFMHIEDGGDFARVDFPGTTFNQLLGINNYKQAAGYYADSANIDHAYIYNFFGGVFEVLTIPGAAGGAQATGINNNEWISGFYIDKNQVNHGFLLAQGKLTILNFPESTFTQALGVNDQNEVVGSYMDKSQLSHGFVYSNGHYQAIDDPDGFGTTTVNGVNDQGQLVGFYVDAHGNTDGFLATPY